MGQTAPAASGGDGDAELRALVQRYVEGENIVLGVVDGQAITVEGIKSQLGADMEGQVNRVLAQYGGSEGRPARGAAVRAQAELAVTYMAARGMALDMILSREARTAGLTVQESGVRRYIEKMKQDQKIDPDDAAAWARFTLQNFSKTPLKYEEEVRESYLREQALSLMAGEYGPIPGLKLPVFFPLEVSPAEIREEYQRTREQWRRLKEIDYSRLAVTYPADMPRKEREKIEEILNEAGRRLRSGETFSAIGAFIEQSVKELPPAGVVAAAEEHVTVKGDAELDPVIATLVRTARPGDISPVHTKREQGRSREESATEVRFVIRLNHIRKEDVRTLADPVVQRQAREAIVQRKRAINRQRVNESLIERAIIVPHSLFLRSQR